jgi:hypothetical protein
VANNAPPTVTLLALARPVGALPWMPAPAVRAGGGSVQRQRHDDPALHFPALVLTALVVLPRGSSGPAGSAGWWLVGGRVLAFRAGRLVGAWRFRGMAGAV